jgi:hypothetical protein
MGVQSDEFLRNASNAAHDACYTAAMGRVTMMLPLM